MSSDIIEYKDYTFVKDGFTRLYDVVLHGKLLDSGLTLNSAYYLANDHWNKRYGIEPPVWEDKREHRMIHTYEVTGVVVRNCNTVDPEFKCIIDADRIVIAQLKAKMEVSVEYGADALLRDVRIKRVSE